MEKVICDVCGVAYPATAAQCPVCGCASSESAQTSAGDTVQVEEETTTTVVAAAGKGGHFSKSNVRKRMKASKAQAPEDAPEPPQKNQEPDYDDDYDDDYDQDDVDDEPTSNRGLIVVVVLLLLAIIAVSSYIVIKHFGILDQPSGIDTTNPSGITLPTDDPADSSNPSDSVDPSDPADPSDPSISIPCTGIEVTPSVNLMEKDGSVSLSFSVEPIDTTDTIRFASSNTDVATVDSTGRVTAVGNGEATITITCGSIVKTCKVTCDIDDTPDVPVVPEKHYYLKLNGTNPNYPTGEYSCEASFKTGNSFSLKIVDEDGVAVDVVWTASKPENVVITGNTIKLYKPGSVTISATHNGVTYSCLARVTGEAIDIPTENPDDPEKPDDPVKPEATYFLRLNGMKPYYPSSDGFGCEASFKVGNSFRLNLVNDLEAKMDVTWTASRDGYVTIDGERITCDQKGTIKLTAEIDGQTYTVTIHINE